MINDFADNASQAPIDCDLCIVGSGPVGLAMARQFLGTKVQVIVLESGGDGHEPASEELSTFESTGHRRAHSFSVRRRMFGGTSSVWSGRCMPFAPLDFVERAWIPHSGWPLQAEEIDPWLQRAGVLLNAGPIITGDRVWAMLGETPPRPWDPESFESQVFQASIVRSPRTRSVPAYVDTASENLGALQHSSAPGAEDLGEASRADISAAPNIRVLLHAHALEVMADASSRRATGVRIASQRGASAIVHAKEIVLACGGIDNARLLLLSRGTDQNGLGNDHDQVGRYLLDHHYSAIAHLEANEGRALRRRLAQRWFDRAGTRHLYSTGASLSSHRQREDGLPRATVYLFEHLSRPAPLSAARRVAEGLSGRGPRATGDDLRAALLHPLELAQGLVDRYAYRRPALPPVSRVDIGCNVEQVPDPRSRVMLSEQRDVFGQPRARIEWHLDDREYSAYQKTARLFAAECERLRLGNLRIVPWIERAGGDWRAALHDMAHPMGSTRMSSSPRTGVVDNNCAVHGVESLHIAGSSVFSTGGTSNPTLLAVALGMRLAKRLHQRLDAAPSDIRVTTKPALRIGIVGAGHRVREVYKRALAALGANIEVVGFVARSAESRARLTSLTGWRAFESLPELETAGAQVLIVAVTPGENVAVVHHALTLGLPILAETPVAWDESAARGIVQHARGRGVSIGIAEQFPFFPVERLKHKLIELGAIGPVIAAVNDFASYDYHGIAQLRAYLGAGCVPVRARAQRQGFGQTGVSPGGVAAIPELGWSEDWQFGTVEMSGGGLLVQNFSPGYATLPTRPRGELRALGRAGFLTSDRMVSVDRQTGQRVEALYERSGNSLSVNHPQLGRIEWRCPIRDDGLDDEAVAVAMHIDALRRVVQDGAAPLYLAAEALRDIEILRALQLSADCAGALITLPMNPRVARGRRAMHRVLNPVRSRR